MMRSEVKSKSKRMAQVVMIAGAVVAGGMMDPAHGQEKVIRDLSADRPDATESPITVDKGMYQIEANMFSYSRDKETGAKSETWGYGEFNVKYGLTHESDIQLVIGPWERTIERTNTSRTESEGLSDLTVRYKYNIWGNDGGNSALAIMPFVTIPTGTEVSVDTVEAGVILPWGTDLTDNISFGTQIELGRIASGNGDHDWELTHTAVIGYSINDQFGIFAEHIAAAGDHEFESSATFGATYAPAENWQLDSAITFGITDAADDLTIISGFTVKF